ncbi:pantoate--beta-alanine ligase [Acinetobacter qingfengensis]|uniref:Pantothenate synthetase n=1 Tax=Acinetobacter qingfengensis TaxID=1262585 RepID=A0A1E7QXC6_9GAMM|nr:pantoate--beta-alanine ligase [Acinetobacter qingfengensis]KAA8731621.1 pantoate--beta-alanine ligase [Acinetobacter qingfengensis]OEY91724.1 pantoate--beta-alanine ligase [Acinetobacter qingfengensis]
MKTETTIQGLNAALASARLARKTIGFVPTMGNLHEGHLSLVREAKKLCDVVVVSIFVNPIQFGPNEDYDNYPRTLEADSHLLADVGCDLLFAPTVQQMYGDHVRKTSVVVSGITDLLCGQSRPGHFDGVATVVTKLFNIVQPNTAFFGQKDWQQLEVIRAMTRDLNLPLDIVGVPIARAEDGLALSSRNGYLTEQQRQQAPVIYQSLLAAKQSLQSGEDLSVVLQNIRDTLQQAGFEIDYVEAYTPHLQSVQQFNQDIMLFVAAKLGQPRLIDNLLVKYIPN